MTLIVWQLRTKAAKACAVSSDDQPGREFIWVADTGGAPAG
jgi:hypothetical protein